VQEQELISIGTIIGTHGYRGLLKVSLLTDFPDRFYELDSVVLENGGITKKVIIESCKPYKQHFLLKFKDIDNLEEANQYRGALLKVTEEQIYPLPEGYYYHFQLKGLEVYDAELGSLGVLIDILETGANDVYAVESDEYGEILIPAIKDVVLDVNIELGKMQVKLLPGLISKRD